MSSIRELTSTKYTVYSDIINLENEIENAYEHINKALNTKLKNNYDEYISNDYEIAMDGIMIYVRFNGLNKKHIIDTMNKIGRCLKIDDNCFSFSVLDDTGIDVDVFNNEDDNESK